MRQAKQQWQPRRDAVVCDGSTLYDFELNPDPQATGTLNLQGDRAFRFYGKTCARCVPQISRDLHSISHNLPRYGRCKEVADLRAADPKAPRPRYASNPGAHHFDTVWFKDGVEVKVEHTFGRGGYARGRRPHPFDQFGCEESDSEVEGSEAEAEGSEAEVEGSEAEVEA